MGEQPTRIMSAEQTFLDAIKQYELGANSSVNASLTTGKLDQVAATIAAKVITSIPGGAICVQVAAGVLKAINGIAGGGPYSAVARIGNDLASYNLVGMYNDIFNGRTYQSDQYWGAVYFYRYFQAKNINNQNQVADTDVAPAIKGLVDKVGVFVSGREHIEALQKGADAYLALYNVNSYTTTDPVRVAAAVAVVQKYMNTVGFAGPLGAWANTVGVYDLALIGLTNNSQAYQQAISTAKQQAVEFDNLPGSSVFGTNTIYVYSLVSLVIVILLIILL